MTEPTPSLADRALARLRKIATGNGLDPAAITVLETQEQVFILAGKMHVAPLCETQPFAYPGGVRGRGVKAVASAAALQQEVARHQKEFRENPDWVAAVLQEIKSHESQGWGLENAKVTLPEKAATYAATSTCANCAGRQNLICVQCQGSGTVICPQCQGQGREPCYYCNGRGEDPQHPGQHCPTCNGTRLAPCRFCQSHRYLPCPTCHGKRGTPCSACQATGKTTQEITVTCGAETFFTLKAEGLPSGLRRGLERIGIANLGKGHADITATPPTKDELETPRVGGQIPLLNYKAALPYAELRMALGKKKAIVTVVGKRCAIMGVPPFLDSVLQPWRDQLRLAAVGKASLEEATAARALGEILSLTVAGKGRVEEVRKLYPFGLSAEAIKEMLADTRRALNKTTLHIRTLVASLCGLGCALVFYGFFVRGFASLLPTGRNPFAVLAADVGILALAMGASWALLNFSTRFVLRKRFPQLAFAVQQKIGKTGLAMLAGVVAVFFLSLGLAPVKPVWFDIILKLP